MTSYGYITPETNLKYVIKSHFEIVLCCTKFRTHFNGKNKTIFYQSSLGKNKRLYKKGYMSPNELWHFANKLVLDCIHCKTLVQNIIYATLRNSKSMVVKINELK